MKQIKLSGRERSVLRYIDWATGTVGDELAVSTRLDPEDLVDVLNALLGAGFVETTPYMEHTDAATFREVTFEVNPSFALELKSAMQRS